MRFAVVNQDNVKDVVSVHKVVWAINYVELYLGLSVINFNNFSILLLMYFALLSLDRQMSQMWRPTIYILYHRKVEKLVGLKFNLIMK